MTQENRTQETPTAASEPSELTAAELTRVVGGGDGPGSPGDNNGVLRGKATPILM
jgi:hypothetical protein